MSHAPKKVVIIGGGITGLSSAYALQERAKEIGLEITCTLIESEKRLGGKITTESIGDFVIEGGPDSFITQKPWGLDLCEKLGLTRSLIETHPVDKAIYILSQGNLIPLPEGFQLMIPSRLTPFLLTPLVSIPGKIRMGLDLLIPRRAAQGQADESIGSFVRRRLGEEAVSLFAEPILAGIYAGDVEKLSLMATFPQFAALEKQYGSLIWGALMQRLDRTQARHAKRSQEVPPSRSRSLFVSLQGGLSQLTAALQRNLTGVSLLTGRQVIGLCPKGGGYEVTLQDETMRADAVVVTVPPTLAARWTERWAPSLSAQLGAILSLSTATISLGFRREEVAHPLNGFGFVVPRREGRQILAATWTSTKFEGRAPKGHVLIRLFIGGAHHEDWVEKDDATLIALATEELRTLLGIQARPTVAKVFRWIKGNPQYHVGHLDRVAKIEAELTRHPGLFLAGAAYRGVGIPDCIHQGLDTAEKAIRLFLTESHL